MKNSRVIAVLTVEYYTITIKIFRYYLCISENNIVRSFKTLFVLRDIEGKSCHATSYSMLSAI